MTAVTRSTAVYHAPRPAGARAAFRSIEELRPDPPAHALPLASQFEPQVGRAATRAPTSQPPTDPRPRTLAGRCRTQAHAVPCRGSSGHRPRRDQPCGNTRSTLLPSSLSQPSSSSRALGRPGESRLTATRPRNGHHLLRGHPTSSRRLRRHNDGSPRLGVEPKTLSAVRAPPTARRNGRRYAP